MTNTCNKPDRDVPGIVCGHSLPCPYHTVVLDKNEHGLPQVRIPATGIPHVSRDAIERLKDISRVLHRPEVSDA